MSELLENSIVDFCWAKKVEIEINLHEPISNDSVKVYIKGRKSPDYIATGLSAQKLIREIFTEKLDFRKHSSEVPFT